MTRFLGNVLFLLVCSLLLGCSGDGKYPVTGTVTWNGEPIPADHNGHVTFMPVDASIAPDSGPIVDGVYSFRSTPGEKKVEILISRPKGKVIESMGMAPEEMYIPEKYNELSELTVEVTAGENQLPFDLVGDK